MWVKTHVFVPILHGSTNYSKKVEKKLKKKNANILNRRMLRNRTGTFHTIAFI